MIFSQDFNGIFNGITITARTDSGSTYGIILTGPTITTPQGVIRKVDYSCTRKAGGTTLTLNEYIGVSRRNGHPRLMFVSDLEEEDDLERTRMQGPLSRPLLVEELALDVGEENIVA